MPIMRLQIKFTDEERALLQRQYEKQGFETEADYIRALIITDGVMMGDKEALRMVAGRLREKIAGKMLGVLGIEVPQRA